VHHEKISVIPTLLVLILAVVGIALAEPKIVGKDVSYGAQGVVMKGYLGSNLPSPAQ